MGKKAATGIGKGSVRKRAEEEAESNGAINQIFLDNLPPVAMLLRPHTREIVACNKAGEEVGAVPGKTCYETWGQSDTPCPWCVAPRLWETGEAQHLQPEGVGRVWDAHWVPISDDLYLHYAYDITERKRAEDALRESEQNYRSLFDHMLNGFAHCQILLDEDDRPTDFVYLEVNDAFERLTGLTREDVLRKKVTEAIPGIKEAHPELFDIYGRVALTGEGTQFDIYFEPLDIWLAISVYSPETGHFVAVFEDITERKLAEEELRRHRDHLEELVGQRTRELQDAQEQLIIKEKLATLGQLAGGVAHELRNPLGAIKNATYLLEMLLEQPDEEIKEALQILDKEVATSERIIAGLFDFSSRKDPIRCSVDLNEVLRTALARIAVPDNVQVVAQPDETLPKVPADPDQLDQAFGNMIRNAVQAMPAGGQLTIKTGVPCPGRVTASVTDTGVGMPPDTLDRLFEPLFTTKAKGIGLGLPLAKSLVEVHGGTIQVESAVGRGTTFTVNLPTGKEEHSQGTAPGP